MFLQQGIVITGAGLPSFDSIVPAVRALHAIFSNHLPGGRTVIYDPTTFKGYSAFSASNRYFTPAKHITSGGSLSFPRIMDPDGILGAMIAADIVYAADNVVEYYKLSDSRYNQTSVDDYLIILTLSD
jgi:hypothetical protein